MGYAKLLSDQDGLRAVAANHPDRVRVTDHATTRAILSDTVWLSQNMLLADRSAMDDIAEAVARIRRVWTRLSLIRIRSGSGLRNPIVTSP